MEATGQYWKPCWYVLEERGFALLRLTAGHPFSVISRYDNSQPLQDVMVIVMAYAWRGTQ